MNYSKDVIDRFWSKVRPPEKEDDCWEWTQYLDKDGYGTFYFNGQSMKSHRFSFELYNGSIQHGFEICHSCDNPSCVNPDHLFLGSHKDNMIDASSKKRFGERTGSNNSNSKLTDMDVLNFLNNVMNRSWVSKSDILTNMPKLPHISNIINRILHRTSWSHLTNSLSDSDLEFIGDIFADRLSRDSVIQIRNQLLKGISTKQIALNFGVSRHVILKIKGNKHRY